jgi:hypothetical protein
VGAFALEPSSFRRCRDEESAAATPRKPPPTASSARSLQSGVREADPPYLPRQGNVGFSTEIAEKVNERLEKN